MGQLYIPSFSEILAVAQSRGEDSDNPDAWNGLVCGLPFQEGGGLTAYDVSGHGNHGTLERADHKTKWTTSNRGRTLEYDGVNDLVEIPFSDSIDLTTLTIVVWINPSASDQYILTRGDSTNNTESDKTYELSDDDGALRFRSQGVTIASGGTINTGQWQLAVATFDESESPESRLYLDGSEVATGNGTISADANAGVMIGSNVAVNRFFSGAIDDVRLYNRALTANEIQSDYRDPWAMYRLRRRVQVRVPAVGGPVAIGLVSETDAPLALTSEKTKTLGLLSSSETALAASPQKTATIGLVSSTEQALPLAAEKTKAIGILSSTEQALAMSSGIQKAIGLASSSESLLPLSSGKTQSLGLLSSSESALSITADKAKTLGLLAESSVALAVAASKAKTLGLVSSSESALAFVVAAVPADVHHPILGLTSSYHAMRGLEGGVQEIHGTDGSYHPIRGDL